MRPRASLVVAKQRNTHYTQTHEKKHAKSNIKKKTFNKSIRIKKETQKSGQTVYHGFVLFFNLGGGESTS